MKAPDTIYIDVNADAWPAHRLRDTDVEYIRTSANIGNVTNLQGRIEYLKGTVEDLKRAVEAQKAEIAQLEDGLKAMASEHVSAIFAVADLRAALQRYGGHFHYCTYQTDGSECTCGFTARAEERKISPQDVTNLLVGLRYDTCDKHDSCEPCKGLRQESIAAIESLQLTVTELRAEREQHVQTLRSTKAWLNDPRIGQWTYMESSLFYRDLHKQVDAVDAALASPPAAEEPK